MLASAARIGGRIHYGSPITVWLDYEQGITARYEETKGGFRNVIVARDGRDIGVRALRDWRRRRAAQR